MTSDAKNDRGPKDLPVPETMRIAALLAELMPPGGFGPPASSGPLSILADELPLSPDAESTEGPFPPLRPVEHVPPPLPEVKVTVPPPITVTPTTTPSRPTRRITAQVVQASAHAASKQAPKVDAVTETPKAPEVKADSAKPPAAPAPKTIPATEFKSGVDAAKAHVAAPPTVLASEIRKMRTQTIDPEFVKPTPPAPPPAKPREPVPAAKPAVPADDLIPLGDLSVSGFFSLVNWRNDKDQTRHPRRSDYGLDEQTLALARRNPFYVIGKPRRPESQNVASVLSEIAWE
jgi:hypothetical protein